MWRPRVLFIGESATLAHVARPFVLANKLNPQKYDVHFAASNKFRRLLEPISFPYYEIHSQDPVGFQNRLKSGNPLFDFDILDSYVREDLALLREVKPNIVVSDLRLSLAVSGVLAEVPVITLTNAHWSRYAKHLVDVVPPYQNIQRLGLQKMSSRIGCMALKKLIQIMRPTILKRHAAPLNRLRQTYGLPAFEEFFEGFSWGSVSLFVDVPSVSPVNYLPEHHRYIGPIFWSPRSDEAIVDAGKLKRDDYVYVSLGSSGSHELLSKILTVLGLSIKGSVYVSLAGQSKPKSIPSNVIVEDYMDGDMLSRYAQLVVCNGGSPGAYQALKWGTPVIGLAGNMDQIINMHNIENAKCGRLLRSDCYSDSSFCSCVTDVLSDSKYRQSALKLSKEIALYDACSVLEHVIDEFIKPVGLNFNFAGQRGLG